MLKNPVALSFDDLGRLYVVETARRSTVDIDIRAHPTWIIEDLSNQSIGDLRRFFRMRMAPEKSLENASWLRDYNGDGLHDWRDLTMVKERVHLLQDTRGTGRADRAQVFAEGFNEEISGVIAGVMPWQRDVFVTVYPDLWRLRDTDGDGVADEKDSWFHGFGVHAAFDGHDLHGLTLGPEGKIYFSIGDNGFSVTNREGRRLHYPNTGGVLRMNPDGSDLEVFATGLRNPQEIAFDEFGNMFAVDNDGDLEDERERFVYITEGSDSGWRLHWQFRDAGWARHTHQPNYNPWIAERMWVPYFPGQPAHITPPLSNYSVGPSGFKYNPGTALNETYRRYFFLVQFPVQKVTAFQVQRRGAAFEMVNEHLFLSGMMASAVNFSPAGALFVADWDGLWEPNEKGAIWVVDDPANVGSAARREVKRLLAEGMGQRSADELSALLGHADMRIRQRAQFELARRGQDRPFLELARAPGAPQLARIHALWGLGQLRRPLSSARLPFRDADPEIRAQTAKLAGDLRLAAAGPELIRQLQDDAPYVRFHAGLALGKIHYTKATPALVRLLTDNDDHDPFLRQAAVMGLAGCAQAAELGALHRSESRAARLGAVVALRRQASAFVTNFLHDPELSVQQEMARAIHDDNSIPEALPLLAAWLEQTNFPASPAIVRRVLNANLRVGTETAARRLLGCALGPGFPEWRSEAVECLATWNTRPYLDRVEGLVRPLSERPPQLGDQLLQENLPRLLASGIGSVAKTLTALIMQNRLSAEPQLFAEWVAGTNQPAAVRVQALELLAQRRSDLLPKTLRLALASD
ncbi:MAG TPA: PVC-type heme-binding CxxCH protein, partial [Verrucomicrobiae bacterium]|nr:PVC-type heme-binding CxxCH protein [Verrucomicrobiae bacterium]